MNKVIADNLPAAESSTPCVLSQPSVSKHNSTQHTSQPFRALINTSQTNVGSLPVNHYTNSSPTQHSQPPTGLEKRHTTIGNQNYVDRHVKATTFTHSPISQPAQQTLPNKKALNAIGGRRTVTDSESEDILQSFLLPSPATIKFEPDVSPISLTATSHQKNTQSGHYARHQKKNLYDLPRDLENVIQIFSPPSRPQSSSSNKPRKSQLHAGDVRQRQSLRESRPPERLVTAKSHAPKSIELSPRVATPNTEMQRRREKTPLRSQISVIIPTSQQKSKPSTIDLEEDQSRKKSLLQDMKRDVAVARERVQSIERHFGTTGFSEIYGTASDEGRLKRIHKLQPKAKKVKRKEVKLDWGDEQPTTLFRHKDLVHPRDQIKAISQATVQSAPPGPPITLVNDINDRQLNGKFQFIQDYVIREGVKRQPAHLHTHVNCSDTCADVCLPGKCGCLRNDKISKSSDGHVPTYRHRPDGLIVLNDAFMEKEGASKSEIMECNNNCRCDSGCYNRLVQRGRTLPMEIFMTKSCGFGLRCPKDIVKGQFIDVYLGELITESMLVLRENAQENGEPSYLFSLDWFNEQQPVVFYQIDGANFGTPMRFINHSCNANLRVFPTMSKEYDQNIYALAIFAMKDIPAMTELTLDYAPSPVDEDFEDLDEDCVKCQCGEESCRGFLWPNSNAKRARRRNVIRS